MEHSMRWKDAGSAYAQLLIFMHILPMDMSYGKHINDFSKCCFCCLDCHRLLITIKYEWSRSWGSQSAFRVYDQCHMQRLKWNCFVPSLWRAPFMQASRGDLWPEIRGRMGGKLFLFQMQSASVNTQLTYIHHAVAGNRRSFA